MQQWEYDIVKNLFSQEVFEFIDVNHDGTIEFEEFLHVSLFGETS